MNKCNARKVLQMSVKADWLFMLPSLILIAAKWLLLGLVLILASILKLLMLLDIDADPDAIDFLLFIVFRLARTSYFQFSSAPSYLLAATTGASCGRDF